MAEPLLPPEQIKAIEALVTCKTQLAAAKKAGVDPDTIRRWLKQPLFREGYHRACDELHRDNLASIQQAQQEANDLLRSVVKGKDKKLAVRAAGILVGASFKASEQYRFDERLREVEARKNAAKPEQQAQESGSDTDTGTEERPPTLPLPAG
jgi:hypothetical protein